LINSCRKICVGWWTGGSELSGGVFGFPPLSFSDGSKEQDRSGWNVGIGGSGAFPLVWTVLGAVTGLDASSFEELPNKSGAFSAVVIKGLVRPLS
jgi:hypothetical protein